MIAATAAAVRAASTLRLVSGAAGLSGNPALVEGVGPLGALGAGAGVDGCAAAPIKAIGCANADGEVIAATGALLAGALWRPTEWAPNAVSPKRTSIALPRMVPFMPDGARPRKLATGLIHAQGAARAHWEISSGKGLALRQLDGGDRPLAILALRRNSQTVKLVKPNLVDRPSLSITEDYGLADKFSPSLLELAEDGGGMFV